MIHARALLLVCLSSALVGPSAALDSPGPGVPWDRQGEWTYHSADRSAVLTVTEARGGRLTKRSESVVELRTEGKRSWRRSVPFGVFLACMHDDGRVALYGRDARDVLGLDAETEIFCFLSADGSTIAVHERAEPVDRPETPGWRRVDRLLPMAGGWTLALEVGLRASNCFENWKVYGADGELLGTLDSAMLVPGREPALAPMRTAVIPGSRYVVSAWLPRRDADEPVRILVHDLGRCLHDDPLKRTRAAVWAGEQERGWMSLFADVEYGEQPSVTLREGFSPSAKAVLRFACGPDGDLVATTSPPE